MIVFIQLLTAGLNVGPFNLYSDANGFTSPFDADVPRSSLVNGYYKSLDDAATQIKVQSMAACNNYIIIDIAPCVTTTTTLYSPTTTTTTTEEPATTTTTTTEYVPYGYCYYSDRSSDDWGLTCNITSISYGSLYGISPGINLWERVYTDPLLSSPFDGHNKWWKMEFPYFGAGSVYAVRISTAGYCTGIQSCGLGTVCPPS